MPIVLYRIDDRLIHGQVVVGWGQPLGLGFIVLVDDDVAASDWEQELYRMGVPPDMEVFFESVETAAARLPEFQADARKGVLLTGDIRTMHRLVEKFEGITEVNVGGIHHREGRRQRLRYLFLSEEDEEQLSALANTGVRVVAQDVPASRALPIEVILSGDEQ